MRWFSDYPDGHTAVLLLLKNNGGPWTLARAEGQEKRMPVRQEAPLEHRMSL